MKREQNTPLISVIIPVYNTAPYLERCVKSILAQTHPHLEILLIDDGSTDASPRICDHLAQQDTRVKVFHKPNGGVSSARNLGLDKAQGEYIGFVDSDDEIHPQMYEVLLENLLTYNADITACQLTQYPPNQKPLYVFSNKPVQIIDSPDEILAAIPAPYLFQGVVTNKLFRHAVINRMRFNTATTSCAEDTEFLTQLAPHIKRVAVTYHQLYGYYTNETSLTHSHTSTRWTNEIKVMRSWVDLCRAHNYSKSLSTAQSVLCERIAMWTFVLLFGGTQQKHRSLLNEQIKQLKPLKPFWKNLPIKQHLIVYPLVYFPRLTIWLARQAPVRKFFNKRYHFDTYDLSS